jgi:hypothetical protein
VFCPGGVVSSPPATKEIGAIGCEFESRQGIEWQLLDKKKKYLRGTFSGWRVFLLTFSIE